MKESCSDHFLGLAFFVSQTDRLSGFLVRDWQEVEGEAAATAEAEVKSKVKPNSIDVDRNDQTEMEKIENRRQK